MTPLIMPDAGQAEAEKRRIVTELLQAFNEGRIDDYLAQLHEDVAEDYPQSGEQFAGRGTLQQMASAFPTRPRFEVRRLRSGGNLVIAEGNADYGEGGQYLFVFIYEFRGQKIVRETAYWPQPFAPADWRSEWVAR